MVEEVVAEEQPRVRREKTGVKGIKEMRAGGSGGGGKPTIKCENCGKMRYNVCYCPRKKKE